MKYMSQVPILKSLQAPITESSNSGLDAVSLTAALINTVLALWVAWDYLVSPELAPQGDRLCWASFGMYCSLENFIVVCSYDVILFPFVSFILGDVSPRLFGCVLRIGHLLRFGAVAEKRSHA